MKNFFKNLLLTVLLGGGTIAILNFLIYIIYAFINGNQSYLDISFWLIFGGTILIFLIGIFLVKKFGWKKSAYKILISYILAVGGFLALPFLIFALINIFFNEPAEFVAQKNLMVWITISLISFIIGIFLTKFWKIQKQVYGFLAPIYIFLGGITLFVAAFSTNIIKFFPIPYALGAIFGVIFFVLGILWIIEYQFGKTKGLLYFLGFGSLLSVIGLLISIFGYGYNPFISEKPIILKNIDSKKFDFVAKNIPNNDNKKLSDLLSGFSTNKELWHNMRYSGDYLYFSSTGLVASGKKFDQTFSEKYYQFSPYLSGQDFENYYQKNKDRFEALNQKLVGIDKKLSSIQTLGASGLLSIYYNPSQENDDFSNEFAGSQSFVREVSSSIYENWIHGNKIAAKQKLVALNELTNKMLTIYSTTVRSLVSVVMKSITYQTIYNISILPNTSSEDKKFLNNLIKTHDYYKFVIDTMKYERLMTLHFLELLEKGDGMPELNGKKVNILNDTPTWIYDPKETRNYIDNTYAWIFCDINRKFGKNEKCEFSDSEMNSGYLDKILYFPGGNFQRNFVGKYFISSIIPRLTGVSDQIKKLQNFENFLKNNLK